MARRRVARRRVARPGWPLVVGVGLVGLILGYLIGTGGRQAPPPAPASPANRPAPAAPAAADPDRRGGPGSGPPASAAAPASPVELDPIPPGAGRRIALVIDDLGRRVQDVADLSELGVPLSFGVLPFETRTREVVEELERRGGEVLLHLPMQPRTAADPGPGALNSGMSAVELQAATRWALGAVGGARGVNNHMGSELSADPDGMRAILGVLAERGLFFLDSRTSPDSVGYRLALEMGMAAAERQVFLDAEAGPDAIRAQFRRLLQVAHDRGSAVAIGHPHTDTLAVLREEIPQALAAGFEFVPVSSLTNRAAGGDAPGILRAKGASDGDSPL